VDKLTPEEVHDKDMKLAWWKTKPSDKMGFKAEGPEKTTRGGVNGSQSKFLEQLGIYPEINLTPLSSNSAKTV
jgi:hypothetical protein